MPQDKTRQGKGAEDVTTSLRLSGCLDLDRGIADMIGIHLNLRSGTGMEGR